MFSFILNTIEDKKLIVITLLIAGAESLFDYVLTHPLQGVIKSVTLFVIFMVWYERWRIKKLNRRKAEHELKEAEALRKINEEYLNQIKKEEEVKLPGYDLIKKPNNQTNNDESQD